VCSSDLLQPAASRQSRDLPRHYSCIQWSPGVITYRHYDRGTDYWPPLTADRTGHEVSVDLELVAGDDVTALDWYSSHWQRRCNDGDLLLAAPVPGASWSVRRNADRGLARRVRGTLMMIIHYEGSYLIILGKAESSKIRTTRTQAS